jgi:hypothetical protein
VVASGERPLAETAARTQPQIRGLGSASVNTSRQLKPIFLREQKRQQRPVLDTTMYATTT